MTPTLRLQLELLASDIRQSSKPGDQAAATIIAVLLGADEAGDIDRLFNIVTIYAEMQAAGKEITV